MNKISSKEEIIINLLNDETEYIENPFEYIYDALDYDVDDITLVKCSKIVGEYNKRILDLLNRKNAELMDIVTIPDNSKEKAVVESTNEEYKSKANFESKKGLEEIISSLKNINPDDFFEFFNTHRYLKNYFPEIKLFILNKIILLKKEIIEFITEYPLANLKELQLLQDQIKSFNNMLEIINLLELEDLQENTEDTILDSSNIIIIPNFKNSSYILDDIQLYKERFKDIKNALNKLLTGNLKDNKNIKQLTGFNQKLYEYWTKTGLRILFIRMDNGKVALSLLFYKDKQKSTRITNYYNEAVKRYDNQKDYLISHLDDVDFKIEQLQLISEITDNLDSTFSLRLKKEGN